MKKLLSLLVFGVIFVSVANADFARVEMGAGAWMQSPSGSISYEDSSGATGLDKSKETEEAQGYVWLLIKHPIPIIPNLRVEYVSVTNSGEASGSFKDFVVPTSTKTTLDMTQIDAILYYNILDNTSWITIDLGVDIKSVNSSYKADAVIPVGGIGVEAYSDSVSTLIPLLYARARVEIPTTNFGLESDVKYITNNSSTIYDVRAKVDYTLDFIPVIQPAVEIGYRVQKMKIDEDDNDAKMDMDFAGLYVGMMLRF